MRRLLPTVQQAVCQSARCR